MRRFLPSPALSHFLCIVVGLRLAVAAPPDAWPGDTYSGALTPVNGILGGAPLPLLVYGSYPAAGSPWRYKTDFTETTLTQFIATHGSSWRNESFDDSSWAQGETQIGYGDSPRDETTVVARTDFRTAGGVQSGPVALFRAQFVVPGLSGVSSVSGRVLFDDSCAVFVNGTEVYRHGDLTTNAPLTEYTETTTPNTRENAEANFTVPLALLHSGANTIAVEVHQHDPGSADLSFDLRLTATPTPVPQIEWTAAGGPYHLTGDVIVPAGTTLVIGPGTRVFADSGRRLIVNGIIKVQGSQAAPVAFSHLPGAPLEDDPREPGMQAVPPKWGGILVQDSLSSENHVSHASFYGAQPVAVEGSVTVVRAACIVEHSLFAATYLHGVYGKNCSLTVQDCVFPDVFPPGKEALGAVLDNLSEFVEVDSPPNDPGIAGNTLFVEGFPVGGVLRLYRNHFYGSSGHNDLVDITSGKWGATPILDAQNNHFHGPVGDEHIDLNGDAYIAGNIFENCTKDQFTSDSGYANAISSDVGGPDTTIVVVRNVFTHCDHAVNVKRGTGVIFEHNTVADVNADYLFIRDEGAPNEFRQTVAGSAINFFIPEDSGRAGDGAYLAWNIIHGGAGNIALPRVLSWADRDLAGQPQKTTKLELVRNVIDPRVNDPTIGSQHPDDVLAAVWETIAADPAFTDRAARSYTLHASSPVRAVGPFGLPPGHTIPAGCYLGNVPSAATAATRAAITVGGPGIFAYQWRLDGGTWSAPNTIAPGVFPRIGPTIRTATFTLENLDQGTHILEVIGQDFAGNWQSVPTIASWLVSATPPAEYPLWLAWQGVPGGSDTDADHLDSLLEYAFGTSPHIPGPPPAMPISDALGISFRLPANAALAQSHGRPGWTYEVQTSEDLSPSGWNTIAVKSPSSPWTGNVDIGPAFGGLVPVNVYAPSSKPRLFLRIRVTQSSP